MTILQEPYISAGRISDHCLELVGNTPMVRLGEGSIPNANAYVKLEAYNPTGSVKDRAAHYILRNLLAMGTIDADTEIVESSSGNYAVALAAYCQYYGLRFRCVIDPNITPYNLRMVEEFGAVIDMVSTPNTVGGYLKARLSRIHALMAEPQKRYWINQYANPLNAQAYYETLGNEIGNQLPSLDYAFVGVSSGGTITGLSRKLKETYPAIRIIAVDTVGSVVFGSPPKGRYIPGIGSSQRPAILDQAYIDDVVWIDEATAAQACHALLKDHFLFTGGSSGTVYAAMKYYFGRQPHSLSSPTALAIFADSGSKYLDTVYNPAWCRDKLGLA
ncbi:2,3-diaminopropionate biosynthesis protein SbnA [Fibrella sp. WM1]|uniref:2,3-diaminopropionate biosynthesis protein SbnA n=1 Tax=Fibrella musci TaxID=3242485 RepID=UPI0035202451